MKKPKIRVKRVFIALVAMVVIISGVYYIIVNYTGKEDKGKPMAVVNEIKAYGYTVDDNETKLYKDLFKTLKSTLEASKVDEEQYASLISELFVIDFYNLNNKLTNSDIGGVQFVLPAARDNFILKAQDTIYKYVESNIAGNRKQVLPIVNKVTVSGVYTKSFKYGSTTDSGAYEVKLTLEYKEDLGYPVSATIIVVHESKTKLAIVELN